MNRFSVAAAALTFVLILLGALVANFNAVGSIPDWPLAFGRLVPVGHLSGGVVYEYAHRIVAALVALLLLGLFVWLLIADRRGWIKWVGALALVLILAQAALEGLSVRTGTTATASVLVTHALLAELLLGVVVSLTVFTSPGWVRAGELRSGFPKAPKPRVFFITTAATAALVVQVMLGVAYRHNLVVAATHIVGALVAAALILWASILVVGLEHDRDRAFPYLTRPARACVWVLLFELVIGILTFLFRAGFAHAPHESERVLITSVIHTGFSAALLTAEVMLLIRLYRMVPITEHAI